MRKPLEPEPNHSAQTIERRDSVAMNDETFAEARRRLTEEIEAEARQTESWTGRATYSDRVMAAIAKVPRHAFVSTADLSAAYDNRPLAIGHGQTISQPYIVAVMTDLLDLQLTDRVLEIGTGCGYQAAVLAKLVERVYTVEIVEELAIAARERLHDLGYTNIETRLGNGYEGWPDAAPFDAIIVTSAPPHIPAALVDQLRPGGRMVLPVGGRNETQMLYRCVKRPDGTLDKTRKLPVAFVPMVDKR